MIGKRTEAKLQKSGFSKQNPPCETVNKFFEPYLKKDRDTMKDAVKQKTKSKGTRLHSKQLSPQLL